uniref:Uncharacterized protein n=1 Tax=Arundo donax TaxID=35708 RepID=A0A0A9AKI9_ARUDO
MLTCFQNFNISIWMRNHSFVLTKILLD